METPKINKSKQNQGNLSSQKTNEDFNKKIPQPKDFPQKTENQNGDRNEENIKKTSEGNKSHTDKKSSEEIVNNNLSHLSKKPINLFYYGF